jgi:hypothetical protein
VLDIAKVIILSLPIQATIFFTARKSMNFRKYKNLVEKKSAE